MASNKILFTVVVCAVAVCGFAAADAAYVQSLAPLSGPKEGGTRITIQATHPDPNQIGSRTSPVFAVARLDSASCSSTNSNVVPQVVTRTLIQASSYIPCSSPRRPSLPRVSLDKCAGALSVTTTPLNSRCNEKPIVSQHRTLISNVAQRDTSLPLMHICGCLAALDFLSEQSSGLRLLLCGSNQHTSFRLRRRGPLGMDLQHRRQNTTETPPVKNGTR